ncbi:MAG: rhodanese-like domain-containing protein [Bacteroidota bacterium]
MKQTTAEILKSRLDAGENIHLVDVREDDERKEFNIGGIHHRLGLIQTMETDPLDDWKEEEIIVYCRSGKRSANACMILETMGFTNVVNLEGGVLAWQEKFGR